jgi:hypothetical protein
VEALRASLRRVLRRPTGSDDAQLVLGAAGLMLVAAMVFRGWALYSSWFYLDDYNLLLDAQTKSPDASYLLEPYNSHLMPGGRLLAWIVADSGEVNWGLAATLTLSLQALAGLAAIWMLVTLFGARWGVLAPLALYLSSTVTVPAMMWWTASLNQVPLQVAFFLAVTTWVRYLRGRGLVWLAATLLAVGLGLLFYVKSLLIVPVLLFLALAYFASGSLVARVRTVLRGYWPAAVTAALLVGGYLAYYVTHVTEPFTETSVGLVGRIADTMLGTAFVTGVLGGPWRWVSVAPPNAYANPPAWSVHAAWVFVAAVVAFGVLRRRRTLRAWALLAGYLVGLLGLLVNSRAPTYGSEIGLEYRYLTDAACALTLCLALAFLPLNDAVQSSTDREEPHLRFGVPPLLTVAIVATVTISALLSSHRYVEYWHEDNASEDYLETLDRELAEHGKVDLAEQTVPEGVIPQAFAPANVLSRLVPLVSADAQFPRWSPRLASVEPNGTLSQTVIDLGVRSRPGPREGCGWFVTDEGKGVPLTGRIFDSVWWIRIGYLASAASSAVVTAGLDKVEVRIEPGINSLYVRVLDSFDSVEIDGLEPGVTMCVDTIEVGEPRPGEGFE